MFCYYNPLDKNSKSIIGAVEQGKKLNFCIKTDSNYCKLVIRKDGTNKFNSYPMERQGDFFTFSFNTAEIGLFWYYFELENNKFIGLSKNYEGEIQDYPNSFQLTIYKKGYKVPNWLNIIYQIFPDRFYEKKGKYELKQGKIYHENKKDLPNYLPNEEGEVLNNDFFGGNLQGIICKLDYIKSLGVNAIYLNPIFEAYSNHRYDTGDYMKIDSLLGSEEDLKELIKKAEEKDIKIILDGVFNHTGSDSIYFNKKGTYNSVGAYQNKKSPYYNWYSFKEFPNDYEAWWGIKTLPAVNEDNKTYVDFITGKNGVIDHYAKLGIGGFRLDVADELPSFFIKKIRKTLKKVDENAILIGEVWEDGTNKISYGKRRSYFQGEELDSVMNYTLKEAIIDFVKTKEPKNLAYLIKEQIDHYPTNALKSQMNLLSTHDTMRILTVLGGAPDGLTKKEKADFKLSKDGLKEAMFGLKVASLLQYTLFGVPSLYYGDEVGLEGYEDPFNRRYYPWGKENKELLSWYQKLGEIRNSIDAVKDGNYKELYVDKNFLCFERRSDENLVIVAVNLGDSTYYINAEGNLKELISNKKYKDRIEIKPFSFGIFYLLS
ncbi:MAG: glycoside hydrolase family 13 protein [Clostridiales bacterium]|nr:glycoside hydrolase family 13 protein [Clostridiales bacterium]